MIFVFDTETTGLPEFKSRSDDPKQPHLVQLAMGLYDLNGNEIESHCAIVRPDGWVIPDDISAIHGITQEQAMDEGVPEHEAVAMFLHHQSRGELRVAHNESFDRRILRIAMTRSGIQRDVIEFIEARKNYCTCVSAKPILNLPPTDKMVAVGFNGPKPPKLEECIRHFFDEGLDGAHDALVDARACARIYFHLQSLKAQAA